MDPMSRLYRSSRPCQWAHPRNNGGLHREYIDGKRRILPMEYDEPGLIARAAGRIAAALKAGE